MSIQTTLPIFCDHCNALALAELDDVPMCIACLVAEIDRQENKRDSFTEIKPLSVIPEPAPSISGPSMSEITAGVAAEDEDSTGSTNVA